MEADCSESCSALCRVRDPSLRIVCYASLLENATAEGQLMKLLVTQHRLWLEIGLLHEMSLNDTMVSAMNIQLCTLWPAARILLSSLCKSHDDRTEFICKHQSNTSCLYLPTFMLSFSAQFTSSRALGTDYANRLINCLPD